MDFNLFKMARQGKVNELEQIIKEKPHLLEGTTPRRNTALHIASRLGHIEFADAISTQCPSLLLARNCRGDTPLHVAAKAGLSDVVGKLIEFVERGHLALKEEILTMVNNEQNTALHEAARNSHERVVHLLLNQHPQLVYKINKDEASALYLAAEGGCLESVKRILEQVNKLPQGTSEAADACRGPQNRTPLHAAVMLQRLDIANELIMGRKEVAFVKDANGNYPLHHASARGNSKMVEKILQSDTSVAYLRNDAGQLPLHVAARRGRVNVIKEFQRFCPDSCEAIDDKGRNALHYAVTSGNVRVVKHFLNSNELRELINEPDNEGNTPLHLAITKHQFKVLGVLVRDKHTDVNVINREGNTALDIAWSDELLCNLFQRLLLCIAMLFLVGGRRGLQQVHRQPQRYHFYRKMAQMISVLAGLTITLSFAAALTIPGGFNSDGPNKGEATLARQPLLWLFTITDATSLFTALYVANHLFLTVYGEDDLTVRSFYRIADVMIVSFVCLTISFVSGLCLVLPELLLKIFIIISLGFVVFFNFYGFLSVFFFYLYYSFRLLFRKLCPRPLSN